MTAAERTRLLGLQGELYEISSRLRALDSLMDRAEEEHNNKAGCWDEDLIAAQTLIRGARDDSDDLARRMDWAIVEVVE